jgi:hypothetical protein
MGHTPSRIAYRLYPAKKVFAKSYLSAIILFMSKNRTTLSAVALAKADCYPHRAIISLSLLLLRRLPPRLTTRDVAAGKAQ